MIADKQLQLAENLSITTAVGGFLWTPNVIDLTVNQDFAAGQPIYSQITIREDFEWDTEIPLTAQGVCFLLKSTPTLPVNNNAALTSAFNTLARSQMYPAASGALQAGKRITLCAQVPANTVAGADELITDRFIYGLVMTLTYVSDGFVQPDTSPYLSGKFDWDMTLHPVASSTSTSHNAPYYRSGITRV